MSKCINCGRYTNQTFCDYCNQNIQKEIKKPTLKYFHNKYDNQKVWKCNNGIYVRSQAERTICDYLYANNIPFEYEKECRYGLYNKTTHEVEGKFIVPDFYIKGPVTFYNKVLKDIYIEFWGRNDKEYLSRKEEKIKIYTSHNSTLINIYIEDLYDYKRILRYKLVNFENNNINY